MRDENGPSPTTLWQVVISRQELVLLEHQCDMQTLKSDSENPLDRTSPTNMLPLTQYIHVCYVVKMIILNFYKSMTKVHNYQRQDKHASYTAFPETVDICSKNVKAF